MNKQKYSHIYKQYKQKYPHDYASEKKNSINF